MPNPSLNEKNVAHWVVGFNLKLVASVQHTSHSTFTIHPMTLLHYLVVKNGLIYSSIFTSANKGFSGMFNPMVFSPVVWDSGVLTPQGPT